MKAETVDFSITSKLPGIIAELEALLLAAIRWNRRVSEEEQLNCEQLKQALQGAKQAAKSSEQGDLSATRKHWQQVQELLQSVHYSFHWRSGAAV